MRRSVLDRLAALHLQCSRRGGGQRARLFSRPRPPTALPTVFTRAEAAADRPAPPRPSSRLFDSSTLIHRFPSLPLVPLPPARSMRPPREGPMRNTVGRGGAGRRAVRSVYASEAYFRPTQTTIHADHQRGSEVHGRAGAGSSGQRASAPTQGALTRSAPWPTPYGTFTFRFRFRFPHAASH